MLLLMTTLSNQDCFDEINIDSWHSLDNIAFQNSKLDWVHIHRNREYRSN